MGLSLSLGSRASQFESNSASIGEVTTLMSADCFGRAGVLFFMNTTSSSSLSLKLRAVPLELSLERLTREQFDDVRDKGVPLKLRAVPLELSLELLTREQFDDVRDKGVPGKLTTLLVGVRTSEMRT